MGKNLVIVEIKSITFGCYNVSLAKDTSLSFAQNIFLVHKQIPGKLLRRHLSDFDIWKIMFFDKKIIYFEKNHTQKK